MDSTAMEDDQFTCHVGEGCRPAGGGLLSYTNDVDTPVHCQDDIVNAIGEVWEMELYNLG